MILRSTNSSSPTASRDDAPAPARAQPEYRPESRPESLPTGGRLAAAPTRTPLWPSGLRVAPAFLRGSAARRLTIFGEPMLFHLTGDQTAGERFFFEQWANPGYGVPSHIHEREDEIFHVLEGEVRFAVGSGSERQEFIAKAGDTVWGPRAIAHEWEVVGTQRARLHFVVSPSGMEHMFAELDRLPPGKPDFAKVGEICARYGIRFG